MIIQTLSEQKTMAQIVQETGVSGSYLTTLVQDLVNQGKVIKTGRGAEAIYKAV